MRSARVDDEIEPFVRGSVRRSDGDFAVLVVAVLPQNRHQGDCERYDLFVQQAKMACREFPG